MKYTFSAIIIAFIALNASGQTAKRSFLIGGDGTASYNKTDYKQQSYAYTTKIVTYTINPSVGYFVVNNLCLGIALPYNRSSSKVHYENTTNPDYETDNSAIGVGPFVRYYVPLNSKFYFISEVNYSYNRTHQKTDAYNAFTSQNERITYNFWTNRYRVSAGVSFFLNRHVGLELLANYQRSNSDNDLKSGFILMSKSTSNNVFFSAGLKIFLASGE